MTITRSRASRLTAAALIVATLVLGSATTAVAAAKPKPKPTTKKKAVVTTVKKKPVTTTAKKTAAPTGAITAQNFAFDPGVLRVAKGTTVTLTNKDGFSHTWTADGAQWDSGVISGGGKFSRKFDEVGTFAFHCNIHPSMKGTVGVGGGGTAKAVTPAAPAGGGAATTYAPPAAGGAPSSGGGYDYGY